MAKHTTQNMKFLKAVLKKKDPRNPISCSSSIPESFVRTANKELQFVCILQTRLKCWQPPHMRRFSGIQETGAAAGLPGSKAEKSHRHAGAWPGEGASCSALAQALKSAPWQRSSRLAKFSTEPGMELRKGLVLPKCRRLPLLWIFLEPECPWMGARLCRAPAGGGTCHGERRWWGQ